MEVQRVRHDLVTKQLCVCVCVCVLISRVQLTRLLSVEFSRQDY